MRALLRKSSVVSRLCFVSLCDGIRLCKQVKPCHPVGNQLSLRRLRNGNYLATSTNVPRVTVRLPCQLDSCLDVTSSDYDCVVLVTEKVDELTGKPDCLKQPLLELQKIDGAVGKSVVLLATDAVPSKRLVFSPTGPLNRDYDDVRRFAEAASAGVKRAVDAGSKKPLLLTMPHASYKNAQKVAALGALQTLYVPLEIREDVPERVRKVDKLGVWLEKDDGSFVKTLTALESGRLVCRDIGGSDPERMAAPRVAEYLTDLFKGTPVKVSIIDDVSVFEKNYPCLAAVNRCASKVDRHKGRIIFLEYVGKGDIQKTLLFCGKGITYDTGGADIKAGGVMAGMHRDKCGAATVAGLFQTLALLQPSNLKVVGGLAMVRNSVGSECYVADEIVTSRAGVRVRVGNTDAEGRMVMTDVLCNLKEMALTEVNPSLFTIATLTGHAIRAMGDNYSIVMDNGPAKKMNTAKTLDEVGLEVGDPFEISRIQRDDYEFHKGKSEYEDVLQANNKPSTMTNRGHQAPAAFMIMASGLDKHGIDSSKPLPYSHMDIAGSSGPFPGVPTACPLVAIASTYFIPNVKT